MSETLPKMPKSFAFVIISFPYFLSFFFFLSCSHLCFFPTPFFIQQVLATFYEKTENTEGEEKQISS